MKKILKFPKGKKQINLSSCGPNVLKHIIFYKKGLHVPEHYLANLSCCSKKNGALIKDIVRVAKNFNLNYTLKENASIEDIIYSINTENPAILLIQEWKSGHYVVANGYDTKHKKIFYYDPLYGKTRNMNYGTLSKVWFVLEGQQKNHFAIFIKD
jgi:ABC-type bacteriocin/lantibiotic exporter with double-glycine peptidase domain